MELDCPYCHKRTMHQILPWQTEPGKISGVSILCTNGKCRGPLRVAQLDKLVEVKVEQEDTP